MEDSLSSEAIMRLSYPSTSSGNSDDTLVTADISQDLFVDSFTYMSESPLTAELITSSDLEMFHDHKNVLNLAYEELDEIPECIVVKFSSYITYIDISNNSVSNLDPLVHFKNVRTLIIDKNPITEKCSLPPMRKLELLWANHCQISSLYPWISKVTASSPHLRFLSLMGNPAVPSDITGATFYENLQYRLYVISRLPRLEHLDDRLVTEDQIAEAQRLYKRPLVEQLVPRGPGRLSRLVHASVSWPSAKTKLASLWLKPKSADKNLPV